MSQQGWLNRLAQYNVEQSKIHDFWGQPLLKNYVELYLEDTNGKTFTVTDSILAKQRVLILGGAGTGKTTLLRAVTHQLSKIFLTKPVNICPIFIPGRELLFTGSEKSLLNVLHQFITTKIDIELNAESFQLALSENKLHLIFDGMDEIASLNREKVFNEIFYLGRKFPNIRITISSRPSPFLYNIIGYNVFVVADLQKEQASTLIKNFSGNMPEYATKFLSNLFEDKDFAGFSTNPLLLRLLWIVSETQARLPSNLTILFSDLTDYLLSSWDNSKGLDPRGYYNLYDLHALIERLAVKLFQDGRTFFDRNDLLIELNSIDNSDGLDEDIIQWIVSSGLFRRDSKTTYSFVHKSFFEYYTARALKDNPLELIHILEREDSREVFEFACSLVVDVAPLIEAAIDRRLFMLAAKCISQGRTNNHQLKETVVYAFVNETGREFINLLIETISPNIVNEANDNKIKNLIELWEHAFEADLPSHVKGERFEDFAEDFFGRVFEIISRNLNTENGEFDLIVGHKKIDPFWSEFGGDILIECKNWSSNVPLKEVTSFINKVNQSRVKLAFFVSVSGFTADATRTLKNNVSNSTAPLVVPITGSEIKTALLEGEELEEFFKRVIRSFKYLRKY